jgi:hypothetical protein
MFLEEKRLGEAALDHCLLDDRPTKHKPPRRFVRPVEIPVLDPCSSDLREAADYIEAHGWCQYKEQSWDGAVCVGKAIRLVTPSARRIAAVRRFERFIEARASYFNDRPWRNVGEVTAALRACAARR